MAIIRNLMGIGMPGPLGRVLLGDLEDFVGATGTTQADAYEIGYGVTRFTGVNSGTGGVLPAGTIGDEILVINAGSNALSIYPNSGSSINALSANAAFSVATASSTMFKRVRNTLWLAADSSQDMFLQSGTGAVAGTTQGELRRWCWVEQFGGTAGADIYAAVTAAWTAGFQEVRLRNASYNLGTQLVPPSGYGLIGQGKANTTIVLTANITPFAVTNVNDTFGRDFLVVAYASQSNPILTFTASTVTIQRNDWDDIQVSVATLNFNPILMQASGAFGVYANHLRRWSISGAGTIAKLVTTAADSWVNSNVFSEFYINDCIIGVDFDNSAGGDGGSNNVFRDWSIQASARTTHGFRIPDSSALDNYHNLFDAFTVYDLQGTGVYCDIGTGVEGTEIRSPEGPSWANSYLFVDNGVRTRFTGSPTFAMDVLSEGHFQQIPTIAGWTEAVTGSGSTSMQAAYNQTRTGTTLDSTARRYTETIGGFAGSSIFAVNYGKPLVFRFGLGRATSEANAVGRIQIKPTQAEGALAGQGIGVRVSNLALYGESYGSGGAFVDLSVTMTDAAMYEIEIRHYPGQRIEWWVDGAFKAQTTTAANIPGAVTTAYLVHSLVTSVSDPSGDAQMFLFHPALWVDM